MPAPRSWQLSAHRADLTRVRPEPVLATLPALPQEVVVDLHRAAVIVVDMQNDFCAVGGWLDSIGVDVGPARSAIPHLQVVLPEARRLGMPVVWLNWANRPDRLNLPANVLHVYDGDGSGGGIGERAGASEAVLTEGSWGAAIVDGLDPVEGDIHVGKYRMSGFWDTPLDSILRALDVDTLFFTGVNADQCVLATLTDAACAGYDCILVEGAAATTSPSFCLDATLYNVRQCFGFTVDAGDLTASLSAL